MNTPMFALLLTSALLAERNAAPTWQVDYNQGIQQTATQKKPLVVIFASGANAWSKVVQGGNPTDQVVDLLNDNYLCVYVDTASPSGKALAQRFAINGGTGVVISNRDGSSQAFWHQGDLSNQTFTRYLTKYADPNVVSSTTETAPVEPVTTNWGASSPLDSYCPSCQNGGSRFRR